jgi:hypothetical protein
MTWFESLVGFPESQPDQVRKNLSVSGETLASHVNGREFICGRLETPSLAELRARVKSTPARRGRIAVREVVADVQDLHTNVANAGSLFQVASQFNLLEMVSPSVTPERGVGIYERDFTQGPACAIAAGAGTIYRNYFAPTNGQIGQSRDNQVDCLRDLGEELGNTDARLWRMSNGYALASRSGLNEISDLLRTADDRQLDALRSRLRIGLQWQTQVTLQGASHLVSQAYCSALPVAYSAHPTERWQGFAKLVLEASYEATMCAAILNARNEGNHRVFLTLLGGGAFGNGTEWIIGSMRRALKLHDGAGLEVVVVSYGTSDQHVRGLVQEFS